MLTTVTMTYSASHEEGMKNITNLAYHTRCPLLGSQNNYNCFDKGNMVSLVSVVF